MTCSGTSFEFLLWDWCWSWSSFSSVREAYYCTFLFYMTMVVNWPQRLHFSRLFLVMLVTCMSIRIKEKYKMVSVLSQISLSTPGTIARQAPVSVRFPRQEYWSGLLLSHSVLLDSQQRYGWKQAGFLPFTITRTCSNSCPLSLWWHPTISSSFLPAFHLSQHQGLFQWKETLEM